MSIRRTIVTGLLLRSAAPAFAAEWPAPIAAAIAERAKSCAEAGGKLSRAREGDPPP